MELRQIGQPTFDEWLEYGWRQGWCGPAMCLSHDGIPMTDDEAEEMYEGDPCLHLIRLYENEEHRLAVEAAHSPSQWRASNQGWER